MQIYQGNFQFSLFNNFADGDYCFGWGVPPYFVLTVHLHGAHWHKVWVPAAASALLLCRMAFYTKQGFCCSFTLKLSLTKSVTCFGTLWIYKQEKEKICEQSGTLTLFKISVVFSGGCVISFCRWINTFSYIFILICIRAPLKYLHALKIPTKPHNKQKHTPTNSLAFLFTLACVLNTFSSIHQG